MSAVPQCVFHDGGLVPMDPVTVTMANGEIRPWWWRCSDPECFGFYDPVACGYHKRRAEVPSFGEPYLGPTCSAHGRVMAAVDESTARVVRFKCPELVCDAERSIARAPVDLARNGDQE